MDFSSDIWGLISGLFGYVNELFLLVATAIGAAFMALRNMLSRLFIGLLAGLGRGAGTGLGVKMTGGGGAGTGTKMSGGLPSTRRLKRAREALALASERHRRMAAYIQAWTDLLTLRGGPHAVSIYLLSLLDPGFQAKVGRLRARCRTFDRLEAHAQRVLWRYERGFEKQCEPLRNEIISLELKATRYRAHRRRFVWRPFHPRRRYYSREIRKINRRLRGLRWRHYKAYRRLNLIYQPAVEPAFRALEHYERTYLAHWVHSFEADLESFRLTVVSGRLVDIVMLRRNEAFRQRHGLADLPDEPARLRPFLRDFLERKGVGFGPRVTVETLFESYLRLKLMGTPGLCEIWGINRVWLSQHLPFPGALGLAHARYGHLPHDFRWAPLENSALSRQGTEARLSRNHREGEQGS